MCVCVGGGGWAAQRQLQQQWQGLAPHPLPSAPLHAPTPTSGTLSPPPPSPPPQDDNKMLTLASNERIPLTSSMRLLLEINHMTHCSPATVSRGGVIFVNAEDVGWKPAVDSWLERLEAAEYRPLLTALFRWVQGATAGARGRALMAGCSTSDSGTTASCALTAAPPPAPCTPPPPRVLSHNTHPRRAASTLMARWSTAAATTRPWCLCRRSTRSRRCAR